MSVGDRMTIRQAAEMAGLSTPHVCNLVRTGKIAGEKRGKFWMVDPASVQRYVDEVATGPLPAILDDAEALAALYEKHRTFKATAKAVGCNEVTVANAIRRHGIQVHSRKEAIRPVFKPQLPRRETWIDVAVIWIEHGLHPPARNELCPRNCPGRDTCLDTDRCVLAENENRRAA